MALEPLDLAALNEHLDRLVDDLPVQFQWNGQWYRGCRSSTDLSQSLEIGGLSQRIEYQLFVKRDQFGQTLPHEGALFLIDAEHMKVIRVRQSPDSTIHRQPVAGETQPAKTGLLTFDMAYARTRGAA